MSTSCEFSRPHSLLSVWISSVPLWHRAQRVSEITDLPLWAAQAWSISEVKSSNPFITCVRTQELEIPRKLPQRAASVSTASCREIVSWAPLCLPRTWPQTSRRPLEGRNFDQHGSEKVMYQLGNCDQKESVSPSPSICALRITTLLCLCNLLRGVHMKTSDVVIVVALLALLF